MKKQTLQSPDVYDLCRWNENSENERYTKEEYQSQNPTADDMRRWNENSENEQYTEKEIIKKEIIN